MQNFQDETYPFKSPITGVKEQYTIAIGQTKIEISDTLGRVFTLEITKTQSKQLLDWKQSFSDYKLGHKTLDEVLKDQSCPPPQPKQQRIF